MTRARAARTRSHTHVHARTHARALRTHARARAHTHTLSHTSPLKHSAHKSTLHARTPARTHLPARTHTHTHTHTRTPGTTSPTPVLSGGSERARGPPCAIARALAPPHVQRPEGRAARPRGAGPAVWPCPLPSCRSRRPGPPRGWPPLRRFGGPCPGPHRQCARVLGRRVQHQRRLLSVSQQNSKVLNRTQRRRVLGRRVQHRRRQRGPRSDDRGLPLAPPPPSLSLARARARAAEQDTLAACPWPRGRAGQARREAGTCVIARRARACAGARTKEGRSASRGTGCDAGPRAAGERMERGDVPLCGGRGERRTQGAGAARGGRKERARREADAKSVRPWRD